MKRSIPTGAWIAAGLVAAAMVIPGVAYAAATLTQIVGVNGATVADVNKAHQLLTAPTAPANSFSILTGTSGSTGGGCTETPTPPAGKPAVITDFRYNVFAGDPALDLIAFWPNATCSGAPVAEVGFQIGNGEMTFNPGISLPAKGRFSFIDENFSGHSDSIDLYIDGYTVPSGALTAASPVLGHAKPR